jgi:hypothetical protein
MLEQGLFDEHRKGSSIARSVHEGADARGNGKLNAIMQATKVCLLAAHLQGQRHEG